MREEVNLLEEQANRLTIKFIAAKTESSAILNTALRIKTASRIIKGGITGKLSLFRSSEYVPEPSPCCRLKFRESSYLFRRLFAIPLRLVYAIWQFPETDLLSGLILLAQLW